MHVETLDVTAIPLQLVEEARRQGRVADHAPEDRDGSLTPGTGDGGSSEEGGSVDVGEDDGECLRDGKRTDCHAAGGCIRRVM